MPALEFPHQPSESVLFITLDSCRFDSFSKADLPVLKSVAPYYRAHAPSHFTYGSHAAMFVGFTPGIASVKQPYLNPKYGKIFKIVGAGFGEKGREAYVLRGKNIVEGFANEGFATIGTGAMGWFDPMTPTGALLTESFTDFFYSGPYFLDAQLEWIQSKIKDSISHGKRKQFIFLNIGETHVPYYHKGASWRADDNPCRPFQDKNRAAECRHRQIRCLEFVDGRINELLRSFSNSTVLICGDHGDCWGEDGLWEHGIAHPMTLMVPLQVKIRGLPIKKAPSRRFAFLGA